MSRTEFQPRNLYFITYPQRFHSLARAYSLIYTTSEELARSLAFREIGNHWAFLYTGADELERQRQAYGLRPICLAITQQILINQGELPPPTGEPANDSPREMEKETRETSRREEVERPGRNS